MYSPQTSCSLLDRYHFNDGASRKRGTGYWKHLRSVVQFQSVIMLYSIFFFRPVSAKLFIVLFPNYGILHFDMLNKVFFFLQMSALCFPEWTNWEKRLRTSWHSYGTGQLSQAIFTVFSFIAGICRIKNAMWMCVWDF